MKSYVLSTEFLTPCGDSYAIPTPMRSWSRLVRVGMLVMALYLLLAVSAGCRQPTEPTSPVSYEDLCGLTGEQMGVMDEEGVRQWIKEQHGDVQPAIVEATVREEDRDSVVAYGWAKEGEKPEIGIAYLRDGRLFRISVQDIENAPTFGQVVAGLGPPEMIYRYAQVHESVLYAIQLDYPALGISVDTSNMEEQSKLTHEGHLVAPLMQGMQVERVECYTPGSMEEVLYGVFFLPPEAVSYQMQRRMPWPGFGALVPLDY